MHLPTGAPTRTYTPKTFEETNVLAKFMELDLARNPFFVVGNVPQII